MAGKIKIGVFGVHRGRYMMEVLRQHPDAALVSICDFDRAALRRVRDQARKHGLKLRTYTDFDRFLADDMEAVIVANYATEHAPFAVRLLDAGRHVCSEVVACQTMAEAVALVEAVERSGKVYTFAENYCYMRSPMEMRRLYRRGELGQCLHAEGEYVHDCESIWTEITYGQRDHWRNWVPPTFYCTHSVGPVMFITGARPVRVSAYETPNVNKRTFGARSGDGAVIVCQMSDGSTAKFLPWCNFRRHPHAIYYALYGSKGMMETDRWGRTIHRLNVHRADDPRAGTEVSYDPPAPMETELSRRIGGHGGSDFYTMHFFLERILGRRSGRDAIDVYTGLDMTFPGLLGYRSIVQGNAAIDIPDFRKKAIREAFRNDHWCPDPKQAGPGQPGSRGNGEVIRIPETVYRRQRAAVLKPK